MLHQDFILRAIEEFARGLARIRELRRQKKADAAAEQAESLCRELLGMTPETLLLMPLGSILDLFSHQGDLEAERAVMAGRLLAEYADIQEDRGQQQSARSYRVKAFCLLDELVQRGIALGEAEETRANLARALSST